MKVGFVGLGRMGQGMARRLLDAGHDLSVFDQFAAQAAPLAAAGAHTAASVAEVAARLAELRELGVTRVLLQHLNHDDDAMLALVGERLLPLLR